jgi:hypothetical protein
MDEMQLLEEFRAVVAPPDPGTLAQARTRVLDGAAAGQASRRARWPRLPSRWPKLAMTGLAAAATATVVTVALAAPGGAPSHPGAASPAARELAYRVADVAAARPAVRPGQWVYRRVKIAGSPPPVFSGTWQGWSTADGTRSAGLDKGKVYFIRCPAGTPGPYGGCQGWLDTIGGRRVPIPVTYAGLSSLPRSPAALDRYLASLPLPGGEPAPYREFEIISALLVTYLMPPPLTAELYRALGDIPGVTVDQHAVNVAGRAGLGFQITEPRMALGPPPDAPVRAVAQLILDPKTYDLIGEQGFETNRRGQSGPRHSVAGTAILKTALVPGPGILP